MMKLPYFLFFSMILLLPISSRAQTACDSIEIVSVSYAPLSDTLVTVHVKNNSSKLFNYPGFVLLNAQGDTVAKETVNFFGIGSEQIHFLKLRTGMPAASAFAGTIELWSGFYSLKECVYNRNFDLCPDSCSKIVVGISNSSSFHTMGNFSWSLLDDQSQVVDTGSWVLTDTIQADYDTLCLSLGKYTLSVPASSFTGNEPLVTVKAEAWNSSGLSVTYFDLGSELPFTVLKRCLPTHMGLAAQPAKTDDIRIYSGYGYLKLHNIAGNPLGAINLYSISGSRLFTARTATPELTLELSQFSSGVYLLQIRNASGVFSRKVLVP